MYNLNLIIYYNRVVEKIKDKKGANVGKLNRSFLMPRAFVKGIR